jgi:hypothetical protein
MPTSDGQYHLTRTQEAQIRDGVSAVEEKLRTIAIVMRACYGEDSQVVVRADEILGALQSFKWELERVQQKASAAGG